MRLGVCAALDAAGSTSLKQFFFAAFNKKLPGACKLTIKFVLLVVLAAIIAFLLAKADSAILAEVGASFIPVWLAGRMTEVFKLGTIWGFKVQYGASKSLGLL